MFSDVAGNLNTGNGGRVKTLHRTEKSSCNICGRHSVEKIEEGELKLSTDDFEYEEPARGEKAEAIRRKYCLENKFVSQDPEDEFIFYKRTEKGNHEEVYLCFEEDKLDSIKHNGKVFYIYRIKD